MDYKKYNDYELIYMVQEEDDFSRNVLYQKYSPIIFNIANEIYNQFSQYGYDYDDFVQEAYIAFQNALYSYDESSNILFYTFVIVCIRRRLFSFCRKITKGIKNISFYVDDFDDTLIVDNKNDVEDLCNNEEIQNIFHDIIFKLSLEEGAIFELKMNGFTYREISMLLDIPVSSAEFRNRKARNLLRQALRKYYYEQ